MPGQEACPIIPACPRGQGRGSLAAFPVPVNTMVPRTGRSPARGNRLLKRLPEETGEFRERNEVHAIIKIHMPGARNDKEFFGLSGLLVGVFAEFPGMGLFSGDEEQGARRYGFDIVERIEIHEFHVA